MNNPLVSVIIPTFNDTDFIEQAIDSIFKQTYQNIELIVIDDGSFCKDAQIIISKYPNIKYLYQEKKGVSVARNNGLRISSGDFIQFLDADDWLENDSISEKIGKLSSDSKINCVYTDTFIANNTGEKIHTYYSNYERPLPDGDIYSQLLFKNFIPIHAILFRKSDLISLGGFSNISGHEDWDLLIRLAEKGKFRYIDKPLGYYREHERNVSKNFFIMMNGKISFQNRIVNSDRFNQLPVNDRKKLLFKYSLQQHAYGKTSLALDFYKKYRLISKKMNISLNFLRFLISLPKIAARSVIRSNYFLHKWIHR